MFGKKNTSASYFLVQTSFVFACHDGASNWQFLLYRSQGESSANGGKYVAVRTFGDKIHRLMI